MAGLSLRATAATVPQQPRNSATKTTVAKGVCNSLATVGPATKRNNAATGLQQGATVPQQCRFDPLQQPQQPPKGWRNCCAPSRASQTNPRKQPSRLRLRYASGLFRADHRPSPSVEQSLTPQHSSFTSAFHPRLEFQGLERPPHTVTCVDNQRRAFRTITARSLPGLAARVIQRVFVLARCRVAGSQRLTGGLPIESSNRIGPTLAPTHTQASCKRLNSCAQSASDQRFAYPLHRAGRVLARVSNHVFHSVEAVGRARGPGAEPSAKRETMRGLHESEPAKDPRHRGVAVDPVARRYIDLSSNFRGPSFQNLAAACSEKVGWPVKPAALTQGSFRVRQIALAASRDRSGAKTHGRQFLSHGEACCRD
jgi:hypothetical protein